jgi:hypothetical protein
VSGSGRVLLAVVPVEELRDEAVGDILTAVEALR